MKKNWCGKHQCLQLSKYDALRVLNGYDPYKILYNNIDVILDIHEDKKINDDEMKKIIDHTTEDLENVLQGKVPLYRAMDVDCDELKRTLLHDFKTWTFEEEEELGSSWSMEVQSEFGDCVIVASPRKVDTIDIEDTFFANALNMGQEREIVLDSSKDNIFIHEVCERTKENTLKNCTIIRKSNKKHYEKPIEDYFQ